MKRILFYDDSVDFGGHEVTALEALRYLAKQAELELNFVFYKGNIRLSERLEEFLTKSKVKLHPIPYKSEKIKPLALLALIPRILNVRKIIRRINPDIAVVVQGNIELGHLGVISARLAEIETISYIPFAYGVPSVGFAAKVKQFLRSVVHNCFYKLPNRFITTSQTAKEMLAECVPHWRISVAYYGPNLRYCHKRDRRKSRRKYGFNEDDYVAAIIGRIHFTQKAHDFVVNALQKQRRELHHMKLLIVGEGPDELILRSMVREKGLSDVVYFLSWCDDLSYVYSAIDALLIPSWFEGLPLVMLEAMYYRLPIIASDRDGMAEVLPKEWLFECGNTESMIKTLLHVRSSDNGHFLSENKSRIVKEFNTTQFGKSFYEALSPGEKP